jgi:hypothetical protein
MAGNENFSIGPQARDIDFYVGGIFAGSISFINTDVVVTTIGIRLAVASSTSAVATSFSAGKIAFASSSILIQSSADIVSSEILIGLIHSDAVTTVTASAMKIATASCLVEIQSSSEAVGIRIAKSTSIVNISSTVEASLLIIRIGKSNIGIQSSVGIAAGEINFGSSSVSIISRTNVTTPIRFSPSFIDYSSMRTLLILDDKPLTNHNRELDVSLSPSFIENRNWNNRKNRYYKRASGSGRKTFSISWRFLPNFMEKTVDTRHGRDYISTISEDPDVHVLVVVNHDQSGLTPYTETTYNVFVRSYSETLLRRDLIDGVYYFDCNLVLEEA